MITRRSFLQCVSAALATFVIPGHRRNIDLMSFCGENERYDFSLPHQVGDFTFATDARMCVRVRPILADALHHKSDNAPPFHTLPWDKTGLVWRPIPNPEPMMAKNSTCPRCEGTGYWPQPPKSAIVDCDCDGGCRDCKERGTYASGYECSACAGYGTGSFPEIVCVDGAYFDVRKFRKIQELGGEYAIDREAFSYGCGVPKLNVSVARFRFADGDGMLMPIETDGAIRRIENAKGRKG